MTYPPVIQFETRMMEAEAKARLALEREAARTPKHAASATAISAQAARVPVVSLSPRRGPVMQRSCLPRP
jgi:hypothetical protein